jgi:signal peptidase I
MPLPPKKEKTKRQVILKEILIYTVVVLAAVVCATLIRVFIFEPFIVPSPSMEPTLKVGDKVIINKIAYRVGQIERGDIVAFHSPVEEKDLVKRAVAIGGDEITMTSEGEIYINGEKITESYVPSDQALSYINQTVILGKDEVFVMGDNRSNSLDSRYFGAISEKDVFGEFLIIYWPPSRWF